MRNFVRLCFKISLSFFSLVRHRFIVMIVVWKLIGCFSKCGRSSQHTIIKLFGACSHTFVPVEDLNSGKAIRNCLDWLIRTHCVLDRIRGGVFLLGLVVVSRIYLLWCGSPLMLACCVCKVTFFILLNRVIKLCL